MYLAGELELKVGEIITVQEECALHTKEVLCAFRRLSILSVCFGAALQTDWSVFQ